LTNTTNNVAIKSQLEAISFKSNKTHLTAKTPRLREALSLFFRNNDVNVPICFCGISSFQRVNSANLTLKLIGLLLTAGKKEKLLRIFFNAHFGAHPDTRQNVPAVPRALGKFQTVAALLKFPHFTKLNWSVTYSSTPITQFLNSLRGISPLFAFATQCVSKQVRKNSRGKSGKYTFVWKYVAPYNRRRQVLRWFAKEIKLESGLAFSQRLGKNFQKINLNYENNFIHKLQRFTYNYVFKNHRKTLMRTLTTLR